MFLIGTLLFFCVLCTLWFSIFQAFVLQAIDVSLNCDMHASISFIRNVISFYCSKQWPRRRVYSSCSLCVSGGQVWTLLFGDFTAVGPRRHLSAAAHCFFLTIASFRLLPNWYRRCLGINKRLWPQWPHTMLQIKIILVLWRRSTFTRARTLLEHAENKMRV